MNRRLSPFGRGRSLATLQVRPVIYLVLFGLAAGAIVVANPLVARAADLSKDIRTAGDETLYKTIISQYVHDQVAIISQDLDPKKTSTARDSLIDEVRGLAQPSPQFLDAYCSELQTQFAAVAVNPAIRVRLNAAIVVAEVAAVSQDARLAQLVIAELNDQSEAVVLWGLKAAREVIPSALGVPLLKTQLLAAVIKAAQRLNTGPIIAAAYYALSVGNKAPANPTDLIGPMQSLLAWRIGQYAGAIPPEPPADARATGFLTERNVWQVQASTTQMKTMQLTIDLIAAAVGNLQTAQPADMDQLMRLLVGAAEAIDVIGFNTADPALQAASKPLEAVNSRTVVPTAMINATTAVTALSHKFPLLRVPKVFPIAATAPVKATP